MSLGLPLFATSKKKIFSTTRETPYPGALMQGGTGTAPISGVQAPLNLSQRVPREVIKNLSAI